MFIRTERLFLRPGWPEDMDELIEVLRDEDIGRHLGVDLPRNADEAVRYFGAPRDHLLPHFFINLRGAHGARLVGGIGLGQLGGEIELGYWIAKAFRGRGYASEAVRAVLNQARALGHRRIFASHFAENPATVTVLRNAGFAPTGASRRRYSAGRNDEAATAVFVADLEAMVLDTPTGGQRALA